MITYAATYPKKISLITKSLENLYNKNIKIKNEEKKKEIILVIIRIYKDLLDKLHIEGFARFNKNNIYKYISIAKRNTVISPNSFIIF